MPLSSITPNKLSFNSYAFLEIARDPRSVAMEMDAHRYGSNSSSYSRTIKTSQSNSKTVVSSYQSVSSYESCSEESLFESMSEKRKPKKVVGRSISLNFNAAHALNLRLRRGHQSLLSPLAMVQGPKFFRQVDCIYLGIYFFLHLFAYI